MLIGLEEKEKTLDEAIGFSNDNFFEYISFILSNRNANWVGTKAEETVKALYSFIKNLPDSDDILIDIDDLIMTALTETSHYAYEAGFKEACRLNKTINSF